jgi:hypothetical protein
VTQYNFAVGAGPDAGVIRAAMMHRGHHCSNLRLAWPSHTFTNPSTNCAHNASLPQCPADGMKITSQHAVLSRSCAAGRARAGSLKIFETCFPIIVVSSESANRTAFSELAVGYLGVAVRLRQAHLGFDK